MKILKIVRDRIKCFLKPSFSSLNKNLNECLNDGCFNIDESTYQDLLLDEFDGLFNKTKTSYGDELFNHWLRRIKNSNEIDDLQLDTKKIISCNKTENIEKWLKKIGKQRIGSIVSDIWDGFDVDLSVINNSLLLLISNVTATVLLCMFFTKYFFIWIFFFLLINIGIYLINNKTIKKLAGSINYLLQGLVFIKKMDRKKEHILKLKLPDYKKFNKLFWCTLLFKDGMTGSDSPSLLSVLVDYFRIFLCLEMITFKMTEKFIKNNIDDIRNVIYFVGYYDCIINNALIISKSKIVFSVIGDEKKINFKNMYHPLLKEPIKQSQSLSRGLIVTGLNMAGKSTYMRSIAINQLLSTTFGFCFAEEFNTSVFNIITSFRINDKLLENKSRYFAEAERIAMLIKTVKNDKSLCFVDEILSGTNSKDRIYGSTKILGLMSESESSIVVSATHDVEIAEKLKDKYDLGYFDGEVDGECLKFDYKLKEGIVSERNGLLILKAVGIVL